MNKPHKHAELIKAWADGATIECKDCGVWFYANNPTWQENMEYRIKPEPKPDVVKEFGFIYDPESKQVKHFFIPQIRCTFDGETGELKSAEVLK